MVRTEYLEPDNVFFLLLNEEVVEFIEFILQQVPEVSLLLGHVSGVGVGIDPGALGGAVLAGGDRRLEALQLLLQFLVGEELVAPFW